MSKELEAQIRAEATRVDWYAVLHIPPKPSGEASLRIWRMRNAGRLAAVADGLSDLELSAMRAALKDALP